MPLLSIIHLLIPARDATDENLACMALRFSLHKLKIQIKSELQSISLREL